MPSIRGRSLSNPTPASADDLHDRPGGGRTVLPAGLVRPKRRYTGADSENALGTRRRAGAGRRSAPAPQADIHVAHDTEIGRAHVGTPVTNAQLVCRLLLEKKKNTTTRH